MVVDLIRSRAALEAEIWMLRRQINVLRRAAPKKQTFSAIDRLFLCASIGFALAFAMRWRCQAGDRGQMASRWLPIVLALEIETAGWPANSSVGDTQAYPRDEPANPLWGAPRIHGELLKIGIEIGQTSVAKYMVRRRDPPSQGWRTFLRDHADGTAAMDMFVVPTISFRPEGRRHGALGEGASRRLCEGAPEVSGHSVDPARGLKNPSAGTFSPWRREWDSLPPCRDCAKTAEKQGFRKSPAGFCDHRRVPPIRPVGPSIRDDFEASENRRCGLQSIEAAPKAAADASAPARST
jgi:hypothetical protein